jgi:ribonuclease HI
LFVERRSACVSTGSTPPEPGSTKTPSAAHPIRRDRSCSPSASLLLPAGPAVAPTSLPTPVPFPTPEPIRWAELSVSGAEPLPTASATGAVTGRIPRRLVLEAMTQSAARELHAFADGGSRGNPGPGAAGWLLATPAGCLLEEGGEALGVCTSNVAEYTAACGAAEAARQAGATALVLHMDSRLVIEQLTRALGLGRGWVTSAPHLVPYQERFRRAVDGLLVAHHDARPRLRLVWVPRERNRRADALVNRMLDGGAAAADEPQRGRAGAGRRPRRSARAKGALGGLGDGGADPAARAAAR